MLKQKGIYNVMPFPKNNQPLISLDLWFNHNWNDEIKPILTHIKEEYNLKIENVKISYSINNIHIKSKRKH